jgi:P27 family predicted phage terminase small subunit
VKQPPKHLNARAKRLWKAIQETYSLGPDHEELLLRTTEAVTRLDAIWETLGKEGLSLKDRFGQPRAHPLLVVETQIRTQLGRLLDQLSLSEEEPAAQEVRSSAAALARRRWSA